MEISADGTIRLDFEGYSAVVIPTKNGKISVCLSCQVGCPVGCSFCRSGSFVRNLTADEILEQFDACCAHGKPTSVVFMGSGEPLLNFDAVSEAIREIDVPLRRITVSTCGVNLEKLRDVSYNVAISLHSPFDEVRKKLVPMGSVKEIVEFSQKRGVMIEYCMIRGITDRESDIRELMRLDFGPETNFNLIRLNDSNGYTGSECQEFKDQLIKKYKCFIRYSRGTDIEAACGMLTPRVSAPRSRSGQSRAQGMRSDQN
ncbi:MAG: radical SAM protein [Candidatus Woesearchaeota archaeon]